MRIDTNYFNQLLAGEVEGQIRDLGQLASFWCIRARMSERGELEGLSPSETKVQLLLVYVGEVGNGGHMQYFWNSSGELAHETVAALCDLGETDLSDALRRAIEVFPDARVPKERQARFDGVEAMSENQLNLLGELDRRVWTLMRDVHGRALAFLRSHRDDVLVAERD